MRAYRATDAIRIRILLTAQRTDVKELVEEILGIGPSLQGDSVKVLRFASGRQNFAASDPASNQQGARISQDSFKRRPTAGVSEMRRSRRSCRVFDQRRFSDVRAT